MPIAEFADLPTVEEIDAELASRGLSEFIRQAWQVIEPETRYLHNWHIDAICEYLQAVDAGEVTRLLINCPPRYMKSITVSVMWPVWSWIRKPQSRWLFASYAANLSTQHSVDRRTIIQSDWYKTRWGNRYQLTSDQNVKTEYQNSKQGRMFSTSFGGVATGKGGDRLVFDDPQNPTGVESSVQRETSTGIFRRKLSTRLNDKKLGAIVVVSQRLGENDISAVCIEQEYDHLCLPAEDKPGKVISVPSGREFVRDVSGLLWPAREGPREIAQAKRQLGDFGYAGQYSQRPYPMGGAIFKREDFRFYTTTDPLHGKNALVQLTRKNDKTWTVRAKDCRRFITVDAATSEKKSADYTVAQVWALTPSYDLLLLDQWRDQASTPNVVDNIVRLNRDWDVEFTAVESDGIGLPIIQTLRARGVTIKPVKARGDKITRAGTAQLRFQAEMIHFPLDGGQWVKELCAELESFRPNCDHDDQCLIAGTMIWTRSGETAIERISIGDEVLTRKGWKRVNACGMTNPCAKVLTILLSNGRNLTGTANHPVFTNKGFAPLDALSYVDILLGCENITRPPLPTRLNFKESASTAIRIPRGRTCEGITIRMPVTLGRASEHCIRPFGSRPMGQFPSAMKFITPMETRSIIPSEILNAGCRQITRGYMRGAAISPPPRSYGTSRPFEERRQSGTAPRKVGSGTATMQKTDRLGNSHPLNAHASFVAELSSRHIGETGGDSVLGSADHDTRKTSMFQSRSVRIVHPPTVLAKRRPVYNLSVEDANEYFANGVLVHNCDALSYAAYVAQQLGGAIPDAGTDAEEKRQADKQAEAERIESSPGARIVEPETVPDGPMTGDEWLELMEKS